MVHEEDEKREDVGDERRGRDVEVVVGGKATVNIDKGVGRA